MTRIKSTVLTNLSDALHLLGVDGVAGDVGEVRELHVEAAELGQDARTAARPPKVLGNLKIVTMLHF